MTDEQYGVRELSPALKSGGEPPHSTPWPHAPIHRITETGVYMVTSGTYQKQLYFHDGSRLKMLHEALLSIASKHAWRLEAWAVFPNHYHFIAHAPKDAATLTAFLRELHSRTAVALNRHDGTPGRKVWHNYWDTRLTHEKSYLARLHYVHQNPVKHGVATVASQYLCCSAAWFERTATATQVKTIYSFKTDQLHVDDDY